MKTFLLNSQTGLYLHGIDKWTADPDQAFDFRLVDRALKYIEIWELEGVELAFAFDQVSQPGAVAEPGSRPAASNASS